MLIALMQKNIQKNNNEKNFKEEQVMVSTSCARV
jgi:hypothetical protein